MYITKFLLVRLSSIGDVLYSSLSIRCLRKEIPNAGNTFFSKKKML